jgi:dienelactone hydrolase
MPPYSNRELRNEHASQNAGHRRADESCAIIAARLHDRIGRDRRRLYAGRRPGAGGCDQDRHRRPQCRRRQGHGHGQRHAGLLRAAGRHCQSAGHPRRHGDFRPSRIHQGRHAPAPDYYFRNGADLTKIDDIPKLLPIVNTKSDTELFADLDATVAWAKSQGGNTDRLGIMGFCRGGRTVWRYSAHNPNLKAGVAFYGSLADPPTEAMPVPVLDTAKDIREPVLGLYGAEDQGIPVDQVNQMKAKLAAAGKTADFKIYPGAPHGFHADYRPSYRKEAAEDGWNQMTAWFKKYGVL